MGGKASLILVLGFAVIFGYINLNITKLTTKAVENMVGYNQVALSRNIASAGAHAGMAQLMYKPYPHHPKRVLTSGNFTDGSFRGCNFIVTIDSIALPRPHLIVKSVSNCTTYLFHDAARTQPYVIQDEITILLDYDKNFSFASFGWMSQQEGNVFFTSGDTLWGRVHSNDNIHIDKSPVFHGKVTTSHRFDPKKNKGIFLGNKEQGVAEIPFPTDLSELQANATNATVGLDPAHTNTRTSILYVELNPGSSASDDGYAIISTGNFMGNAGAVKVDSIKLSDYSNNVIYSTQDIHIKGVLDGRLSVASNDDVLVEGNTVYENYPDAYNEDPGLALEPPQLTLAQNQTKDMLGLVGRDDVIIPSGKGSIAIHGAVFAKDGSFTAQDWNVSHNPVEWRINLIGSICQNTRGAVGQTNGNGYKKSYRFDPRFDENFADDENMHPPSFPSYPQAGSLYVRNWWEKPTEPLIVQKYY
ncbi:MAG: hypothetical protein JXA06_08005 [Bacteroidetes bacterium]|nr:hypothetical protein [Bacteroidota bacterium]